MGWDAHQVLPQKFDGAGAGVEQAGDSLQRGGFAGAVGADQGDNLSGIYLERDALDGVYGAVVDVDVADFQNRFHGHASFCLPRYASMTAGLD